MRNLLVALMLGGCTAMAGTVFAAEACGTTGGDVVIEARTPEVDLYEAPDGRRVETLKDSEFPACTPITGRAPNMMLQVKMKGATYWVPPHMVKYRFAGNLPPVCRNLALGSDQEKVGSTRGLGEGCPKPGNGGTAP